VHKVGGRKSGKGVNRNTHSHECARVPRNVHVFLMLEVRKFPNLHSTCDIKILARMGARS
jgi:hypothetical protein